MSNIPNVKAEIIPDGEIYSLKVKCPFCNETHTHGGGPIDGDPKRYLGDRVSHCHKGDYNLV